MLSLRIAEGEHVLREEVCGGLSSTHGNFSEATQALSGFRASCLFHFLLLSLYSISG